MPGFLSNGLTGIWLRFITFTTRFPHMTTLLERRRLEARAHDEISGRPRSIRPGRVLRKSSA